jgi:hypothetical protein
MQRQTSKPAFLTDSLENRFSNQPNQSTIHPSTVSLTGIIRHVINARFALLCRGWRLISLAMISRRDLK